MERRVQRASFVGLMRLRQSARACARRNRSRDFAIVLMVAAVVGVLCQMFEAVIDLGRSAGWWP